MHDAGLLNDLWILKGVVTLGEEKPVWVPLELPGIAPSPRKAHALAGELLHPIMQHLQCCGHSAQPRVSISTWGPSIKHNPVPKQHEASTPGNPLASQGDMKHCAAGVVNCKIDPMLLMPADCAAALGWHVFVMGGHTSETGWFARKTDIYHNDVVVMDRQGTVQWRTPSLEGELPAAREYHTLTPVSSTRLLLFGGALPPIARQHQP